MSGTYKGLQTRIQEINPLVEWLPCPAHTLNLVGVTSVNCCLEANNFLQSLFNFCSKSTTRWQIVTAGLEPNDNKWIETLKALSNTRWSANAQATKALFLNYASIQESPKTSRWSKSEPEHTQWCSIFLHENGQAGNRFSLQPLEHSSAEISSNK